MRQALLVGLRGVLALSVLGSPCALRGQAGAASSSSAQARELLHQAVEALGGEAFLQLETQKLQGRVYSFRQDRLTGLAPVVSYTRFPDQHREEYGKNKEDIQILDGEKGWYIDIHGVKEIPPEEMRQNRVRERMSVFYILRYRLEEPGSTVQYAGRDLWGARQVDVVHFIDRENRLAAISLDRQSRLPVRVVWARRDERTRQRIEEVEILANYHREGRIMAPRHYVRQRNGTKVFEAFVSEVIYNVPLPDSLFVPRPK